MAQRYLFTVSTVLIIIFINVFLSNAAPSFVFKKSFSTYNPEKNPPRAERRLTGKTSPIHFISPFMMQPQEANNIGNFFAPQASFGNPASSSIYKLPLRLFSNGKPHAVFHGIPKPQKVMDFLPHTVSNIIRLPLKYISNAKPIGIYFHHPSSYNYL